MIVTLEEHSVNSGLGSIINNFLMRQGFSNIQVLNLGIPETYLDHGSYQDLINEICLTPEKIVKQINTHFNLYSGKEDLNEAKMQPHTQRR